MLLTEENVTDFLEDKERTLKTILFTKKSETPGLWIRLSDAWGQLFAFGEVRHVETSLMEKFGISVDSLPKVIAVLHTPSGPQNLTYEGPTDFEHLSEFLRDAGQGGPLVFDLKKQLDEKRREIKGLKLEISQHEEALNTSRAEIARVKLGQFGSVEAVKRTLEAELKESKEKEEVTAKLLEQERQIWEEKYRNLEQENEHLRDKVSAVNDMEAERVIFLNDANVDTFFASRARPLKGVLFTTKPDIPPLWQQLAEAQAMTTAFAVVRHCEQGMMEKFELAAQDLPRICLFREDIHSPVVYDGEVDLQCLSDFFKDAVEGGETVLAMKQRVHSAVREVEDLTQQLEKVKMEAEEQLEESEQRQRTMQYEHELTVNGLRTVIADAREEAERMVLNIRQDAERRCEVAESELQGMRTLLHQERSQAQNQLKDTINQLEAEIAEERKGWSSAQQLAQTFDLELKKLEQISKTCEKQLLRAASSVHVTLTRSAREKERMQASLREFIDDVVPSQVTVSYDKDTVARAVRGNDSDSIIDTLSKGYKSMKEKLKVLEVPATTLEAESRDDTEFMSSYAASKSQAHRSHEASSASDSASIDSEQNHAAKVNGDPSKSRLQQNGDGNSWGDLSDKANFERAKRKQLRDEVTVLGYEGITIGQMTKESEKTDEKNIFLWRGRKFQLLYNGKYRDKLIDVETGTAAYQYPAQLEVARIKMKERRSGNYETGTNPDSVVSMDTSEQSPVHPDERFASNSVESASDAGSKASEGGSKDADGSKSKLSFGRLFFSSTKKETAPPEDPVGTRQISRNRVEDKDRMPALVNGVLVLAPAQSSESSRPVSQGKVEETTQRWSPRSGTSEEDESPLDSAPSSRTLPSQQGGAEEYGAWGSAPSTKGSSRAPPPPSIWSDDEDEVVSSTQLFAR